jgi:hypothetical protein
MKRTTWIAAVRVLDFSKIQRMSVSERGHSCPLFRPNKSQSGQEYPGYEKSTMRKFSGGNEGFNCQQDAFGV